MKNEKVGLPDGTTIAEGREVPRAGEKRLSPEEARLEANMMRIKLKEVLRENLKHEPAAADYDQALAMVEDLKLAALMEDPDEHEELLRRNQILEKYFDIGAEAIIRILSLGLVKKKIHMGGAVDALADARSLLERLKAEAEKPK